MRIRVGASCAFLAVLGGTLSACSSGDDGGAPLPRGSAATGADAPSPASVDPWTLPIEERPELFNPCTEISLEDLEAAGLENPTPRPEAEDHSDNPPLRQCGWEADNFTVVIGTFWRRMNSFAEDSYERITSVSEVAAYSLGTLESERNDRKISCAVVAETVLGLVSIDVVRSSSEGNTIPLDNDACEDLNTLFRRLSPKLPEPQP